jgi:phosphoribosyl-ATP pyrophosphohydrolase
MAGKDGVAERIVSETADLWFHTLVVLVAHNLSIDDVLAELDRRFGRSGLDEKASRRPA